MTEKRRPIVDPRHQYHHLLKRVALFMIPLVLILWIAGLYSFSRFPELREHFSLASLFLILAAVIGADSIAFFYAYPRRRKSGCLTRAGLFILLSGWLVMLSV